MFMPRGIRNNNFGNIEDGSFAQGLPGYSGTDGRFATFQSPQDGMNAIDTLLSGYGRRGINTVNGIVNKWAPSSDGNNTGAYAAHVSGVLGTDPNAPIDLSDPNVRMKVAQGIAQHENGPQAFAASGAGSAAAPTDGVDATSYGTAPRSPGNFGPTQNPGPQTSTLMTGKRDPQAADPNGFMAGGPGAWIGMPNGVTSGGYDAAGALQGAGAALASIGSPAQGMALAHVQAANGSDKYQMTVNPATGAIVRINKTTGKVESVTNAVPTRSKGDDAYDEANAKLLAEQRKSISESSTNAAVTNSQLDQLQGALSNPNVYQGFGGDAVLQLKKAAQAAGFNVDGIADSELAGKISKEMALKLRNPVGGAGMPGSLSDSDRQYLTQMVAGLGNSKEGNQQIVQMYKALNQRSIDIDNLASQYEAAHGGRLDSGFRKYVADFANNTPLFPKQQQQMAPAASAATTNRPPLDSIFK